MRQKKEEKNHRESARFCYNCSMKAVQINKYGGSEVLEISENAQKPIAGKDQILVEVHAASINPFDFFVLAGSMKERIPLKFPATMGGDFSGEVVDANNSSNFKIGDQVYGSALLIAGSSGGFAEFAAVNIASLALKPKNANFEEAASLPLVGSAAVQALEDHIKLQKGQRILIHGGAGGIGSIAIQLAKVLGAYVSTTVSSNDMEFARTLGADQVIDYKSEQFSEILKDYDAVFTTVGGETVDKSFLVLKKEGILVSMLGQPNEELAKEHEVTAIGQRTNTTTDLLIRLARYVEDGKIKPEVDKIFPIDQAREAFEYQENQSPKGKVVLKIKKTEKQK